LGHPR